MTNPKDETKEMLEMLEKVRTCIEHQDRFIEELILALQQESTEAMLKGKEVEELKVRR